MQFDPGCRRCPRLARFLDEVQLKYPEYHARPVPPFGDANARVLVLGLAPGMHGANASGRPFTGDFAGIILYRTLHQFGFSSSPESLSVNDGLELSDCRISNAVKCLPPQNRPLTSEIAACNGFLRHELNQLPRCDCRRAGNHRPQCGAEGAWSEAFGLQVRPWSRACAGSGSADDRFVSLQPL